MNPRPGFTSTLALGVLAFALALISTTHATRAAFSAGAEERIPTNRRFTLAQKETFK